MILFEQIKSKLGVTKNIRLLKGETSLLIGILSPAVILSRDCAENEKSIVIAHELVHYKRKDNIDIVIETGAQINDNGKIINPAEVIKKLQDK